MSSAHAVPPRLGNSGSWQRTPRPRSRARIVAVSAARARHASANFADHRAAVHARSSVLSARNGRHVNRAREEARTPPAIAASATLAAAPVPADRVATIAVARVVLHVVHGPPSGNAE